jgi:hypothetical protein
VVDGLVAAGATVRYAVSHAYQLTTTAANQVLVRRASDDATAAIGIDSTTHLIDSAALAAHCGASDGFAVTLYDRGGNARDFTNATPGEQPKIYDGATGILRVSALPVAQLTGGAGGSGSGKGWARGDGAGYSATDAVCVFYVGSFTDVSGFSRIAVALGTAATLGWSLRVPLGNPISIGRSGGATDGSYQRYTAGTAISALSGYVARIGSGTPALSTSALRQRGIELAQDTPNSNTMSLSPTAASIGSSSAQAAGVTGDFVAAIGLAAPPDAAQLAVLDAFDAALGTLAGR